MLSTGTHITCEGTEDCTLTIGVEPVTGALSASSTGGMVSVSTMRRPGRPPWKRRTSRPWRSARAALAALDAMDPGDVTANQRAAAEMALANALALPGNEGAPENQPAPPDPTPEPPPPPPTPVAVTVPDAMYLDDANMPTAGSMTIAAGMTGTSGGVTFLCAEGGDACEVTVADDGSVTATGGTVTASLTAAAMTQVAEAKDAKADEENLARLMRRDRAIGKDRALEGATNVVAAGTATEVGEDNILISRAAGKTASVRVGPPTTGFSPHADGALPNGDWHGARLMRAVTGGTQHLFVYTDIEAPKRVQFYNWDGDSTTPARYSDGTLDALTVPFVEVPGTTDVPALALTGALLDKGDLDPNEFEAPGPRADGNKIQRFRMPRSDATSTSFRGNYNGAPGTYTCTVTNAGDDCVVTIPPTGLYLASVGTWTFTPEVGATAWRGDSEFMSFGWWLQEPLSQNGAYTFKYYVDGTAYTTTAAGTPTGTATYAGRAAGKYVVQETDDTGVIDGMAGQFVAAASLTANFSAAPNPTIEGSISDFQGEGMSMSGWEVTLHRKSMTAANLGNAFPASAQTDPTLPRFDGVTATMGDQTAHGDWTGQFFGNAMATQADGSRGPVMNAQPLGVGGTFEADNDSVSIAGAFGARR